ncbi:mercuric reductase [Geomonas sp. Red69]|uniref:mercuric reductase n=1 Tax=Geomonas diazotrophica TaxID=2843197 RepID=UPI001C112A99|nr:MULTISPECIES: mercuric reductase [Geomonas]MBU5637427.1 mercuric reductase [Geomonas diazotrophica]QXE88795.1 mercuric reductase [Geomonas nitrogeniifigens]
MSDDLELLPDTEENRLLAASVRPEGWRNPEPAGRYNLVVVGAGTAGLVCAAGAAGLGGRVALVERGFLGGDCLNVGCVPSKGLLRAARAVFDARSGAPFGVGGGEGVRPDFGAAMERMRRLRADIGRHDAALRFRDELGVDVFFGTARFTAADRMEVAGAELEFARAAICTGARAAVPPIPGLAEAGYLTNETVFSLTVLPATLAVIGGGPIGCELAQAFGRFGSKVTIVEPGAQLLGRDDPDAAAILQDAFGREGMALHLRTEVVAVERRGGVKVLQLQREGVQFEVPVESILVGTGRAPNVEGLGLEAAGIACDRDGVTVSETLQTSNPRVYAAGDVCSRFRFTHTADAQARILIANALFKGRRKNSSLTIPWCTYTDPEVAHVGMYPADAAARGIEVDTLTVPFSEVDRAVLDGEEQGFARVHLKKGGDTILGATIVARHAGEMISEMTLAIGSGLGLAAIGNTIHPYPTQAESWRKLADAYQRRRLTPLVQRLLRAWLAWQRKW